MVCQTPTEQKWKFILAILKFILMRQIDYFYSDLICQAKTSDIHLLFFRLIQIGVMLVEGDDHVVVGVLLLQILFHLLFDVIFF